MEGKITLKTCVLLPYSYQFVFTFKLVLLGLADTILWLGFRAMWLGF